MAGRIVLEDALEDAVPAFDRRLTKRSLTAFGPVEVVDANRAVASCIDASLEDLSSAEAARFSAGLALLLERWPDSAA
jgi:hypothetical protein